MKYLLVQALHRCHCGTGQFLGHRFYPQPFFLLQLAGKLRRQGHIVKLVDCFNGEMACDSQAGRVTNIGEYVADAQYKTPRGYWDGRYSGSWVWLHRPNVSIIEPEEVFGEEPAWDLIDFEAYPRPEGRLRAVIRLSLGCPNHCTFCPVPIIYKGKYRRLDLNFATDAINYLIAKRKVKEISIIDDNLFADISLGKSLLRWIVNYARGIKFFFQEGLEVRQALDLELCQLLKEANFYDVRLGVETLDEETLKRVNKPYVNHELAVEAVANLQKVGFNHPRVFLITELALRKDEEFFRKMGCQVRNQNLKVYSRPQNPTLFSSASIKTLPI